MMDKNLKDNEIIRDLEQQVALLGDKQSITISFNECIRIYSICEKALELVKKYQAENEDLGERIVKEYQNGYKTARAEAYKEFAEKLEMEFQKTENQVPSREIIKQTIQICKNAIRVVLKELECK